MKPKSAYTNGKRKPTPWEEKLTKWEGYIAHTCSKCGILRHHPWAACDMLVCQQIEQSLVVFANTQLYTVKATTFSYKHV